MCALSGRAPRRHPTSSLPPAHPPQEPLTPPPPQPSAGHCSWEPALVPGAHDLLCLGHDSAESCQLGLWLPAAPQPHHKHSPLPGVAPLLGPCPLQLRPRTSDPVAQLWLDWVVEAQLERETFAQLDRAVSTAARRGASRRRRAAAAAGAPQRAHRPACGPAGEQAAWRARQPRVPQSPFAPGAGPAGTSAHEPAAAPIHGPTITTGDQWHPYRGRRH